MLCILCTKAAVEIKIQPDFANLSLDKPAASSISKIAKMSLAVFTVVYSAFLTRQQQQQQQQHQLFPKRQMCIVNIVDKAAFLNIPNRKCAFLQRCNRYMFYMFICFTCFISNRNLKRRQCQDCYDIVLQTPKYIFKIVHLSQF